MSAREEACGPGQGQEDVGCCQPGHLLPRRHTRCLDGRVPGWVGWDPGSEGSWGEAQVCPTCIPLGLGISGRRALLRGCPRPLAHFSAGAAGRRREGNSSGNHSPEPRRPRNSEHRAEAKEPVLRKYHSETLQVSLWRSSNSQVGAADPGLPGSLVPRMDAGSARGTWAVIL